MRHVEIGPCRGTDRSEVDADRPQPRRAHGERRREESALVLLLREAAESKSNMDVGGGLAVDYEGRDPILVGSLKACVPFICDLSRAMPIHHALDFVELAGYGENDGGEGIRFLKDLTIEIETRHVLLVDEVVDTGLTMNYLSRTLAPRNPASLTA